ncbi:hypothetical protein EV198_0830 [Roseivirga ehrenbergii]|uniref:Uncharacterized protein n=1 Tax=Roseivirga ehrenbergii (strain DSM 102268 / JCM 13514 / KCTC 12282 / NCIMB 14502 / KMM 6017) TaxID=279360 RepID=A0A150X7I2_ROSEK|nr:hypothetical protein [Roseivirga ehrenbergii]KYG74681.1 hypothetical protein MB14_05610 [Roseivirga ehrenbergii]TCL13996.1 hypothetical protein EV198_0830 [Roseivirga ehrenbergii]
MSNELTLGIIGVYTLVYVIVFIIQKKQIDKQNDLIISMKSFIEIFDLAKVSDYVNILDKRADLKTEIIKKEYDQKFIDEKLIPFTKESILKIQQDVFDFCIPKMDEMKTYILADIILKNLKSKEDKIKFIKDNFKETKSDFTFLVEKLYSDKTH